MPKVNIKNIRDYIGTNEFVENAKVINVSDEIEKYGEIIDKLIERNECRKRERAMDEFYINNIRIGSHGWNKKEQLSAAPFGIKNQR